MSLSRLELVSSHGDQTLPMVRFVLHGTPHATESISIMDEGLRFVEGRPSVTSNLVHAHDWTVNPDVRTQTAIGEPGSVIVCAIPQNYHLGYGIFTTSYIDRTLKRVTGAPLRYAAGRSQLALYLRPDTEASRVHIESEVANGYPLDQHPQEMLEPKYIVGSFEPGPAFDVVISQLDVSVRSLEPLDFERLERNLMSSFRPSVPANAVLAPSAIRDVIVGTVESMLMSRMRMMRWQGLMLLGYTFAEGQQQVQVPPVADLAEQKHRIDELGRQLGSTELFTAELAWLKTFVAQGLGLMRVELDGAELASAADSLF